MNCLRKLKNKFYCAVSHDYYGNDGVKALECGLLKAPPAAAH